MPEAALVLVDSSVWIQFFRAGHSTEAVALDALLDAGPVATCAPIRAEVVSGARTLAQFHQLGALFASLIELELPADVWARVAEHRFALAKRGQQMALVDLLIAATAHAHHADLWTLDDGLLQVAAHMSVSLYRTS